MTCFAILHFCAVLAYVIIIATCRAVIEHSWLANHATLFVTLQTPPAMYYLWNSFLFVAIDTVTTYWYLHVGMILKEATVFAP